MGHTIPDVYFYCPGSVCPKRQIEGTVISQEDKEPLIGATVIVKGSPVGSGDRSRPGHFTLEVDPDAKFIIGRLHRHEADPSTYPEKRYLKRGFTTGGDEPR